MPARLSVPDRVRWAVDVLDAKPADMILETGCGPGVAAALVCERLRTGQLLAVDRSPVAVRRTADRNAAHVTSGRLVVRRCELDELVVPAQSFDRAFAINVNLFWVRSPAPELAVLRQAIRPDGMVYLLYGAASPTSTERVTASISTALRVHGFTAVEIIGGRSGVGVSARVPTH
ncbi:MAG: class I SAM-dependent methyltransferase [Pseudonocardiales bacterium]|nr:class I SAM-dependent methyltransferase [Pseudonocardiales bacterium]